ncbi:hypothetical protein LCGC14_0364730 [marine sediment metagenome]|uniref:Uncharacterized protein n=1 Tax=marine sediment metagenome TaxID=412755 RepID=A0A0F9VU45_9ZZZZ
MPKTIRASDILKNFSKVPRTDLVIDRIRKVEERKREEEESKLLLIDTFRKVSLSGSEAARKHKIAKAGGFDGGLLAFLTKPEEAQVSYELGLDKVKADPSILGDNFFDKIGQAFRNLFGSKEEVL